MSSRLNELKEMAFMARRENRLDILDGLLEEMKQEFQELDTVIPLVNEYMLHTPQDQILSNQLNNLISYFGRDKVAVMAKIILNKELVK